MGSGLGTDPWRTLCNNSNHQHGRTHATPANTKHCLAATCRSLVFCSRAISGLAVQELADQVFQHHCRLRSGRNAHHLAAKVVSYQPRPRCRCIALPNKPAGQNFERAVFGELRNGLSMDMVTVAWKDLSSKVMASTRPTTTPALLTAALGLRPPMLSNLAVTVIATTQNFRVSRLADCSARNSR